LLKEGIGVPFLTATAARRKSANFPRQVRILGVLAWSGFRRFATYRQATAGCAVTNMASRPVRPHGEDGIACRYAMPAAAPPLTADAP
jgi:hypothetical protein